MFTKFVINPNLNYLWIEDKVNGFLRMRSQKAGNFFSQYQVPPYILLDNKKYSRADEAFVK